MARIRQIRDVITVRQQEDLKSRLTYKEIEVKALLQAIHGAAGNAAGVKQAENFRFHEKPREVPNQREVARFFRPDDDGLITDDMLAAEIERLKARR